MSLDGGSEEDVSKDCIHLRVLLERLPHGLTNPNKRRPAIRCGPPAASFAGDSLTRAAAAPPLPRRNFDSGRVISWRRGSAKISSSSSS